MIMAAALLAACENPLEYKPANVHDELIMNALLTVDEDWHKVYVAVSHTEYVSQVKSGELRCYVNGTLAASTSTLEDLLNYSEEKYGRYFRFQAPFKAGDKVRIEIDADGKYSAWNEQVVPDLPTVTKVDTVSVYQRSEWGSVSDCYRFDIGLRDSDAEADNFFRLDIINYSDQVFYKDGVEIARDSDGQSCSIFTEDDPILNEGHFNSGDLMFEIGATNEYGIVTDNMFSGTTATLRPIVSKGSFGPVSYVEGAEEVEADVQAIVKVYGISKQAYYYFKALNMLRGGGGDLALEDVQIPDNIEGGIGFIVISNPVIHKFSLWKKTYQLVYYGE